MKRYFVKEKGKYRRVNMCEFPCEPADGVWLVMRHTYGRGHHCVARLSDLPKIANLPDIIALQRYKDDIASIITDKKPQSACDMAGRIINFIVSKRNV